MDDIQLCKEITRLKKELHKLVSLPGGRKGFGPVLSQLYQGFYPESSTFSEKRRWRLLLR